jgi:ADP-heptose:LPS heptosyltransferase
VNFVGLQNGLRDGDADLLRAHPQINYIGDQITPFEDTAAAIALMDVVISSDTAMVHLAGALGRPTWILLPHLPDWRWRLDGDRSPWYPAARLFRQPRAGDWASVIAQVTEDLSRELGRSAVSGCAGP